MLPQLGADSIATPAVDVAQGCMTRVSTSTPYTHYVRDGTPMNGLTVSELSKGHGHGGPSDYDMALEIAKEKVRSKAAVYMRGRSKVTDEVFASDKFMGPSELRYVLRYAFGVHLTNMEHVALTRHFDRNNDGSIDTAEFMRTFFQLGGEGKERERRARARHRARVDRQKQAAEDARRESMLRRKRVALCPYSQQQLESVQRTMATVAANYDSSRDGLGPGLSVFEGRLDPLQFREQLRRTLHLTLSPQEFSALFDEADRDRSGTIGGAEFKFEFLRSRRAGVLKAQQELKEAHRRVSQRKKRLEKRSLKQFGEIPTWDVDWAFSEEDEQRALDKVGRCAAHFDPQDYRNQNSINAFKAQLDATGFADQLVRAFDIRLTPKELGALMTVADRNDNGTVEGEEFWIIFQREGARYRDLERVEELKQRAHRRACLDGFLTRSYAQYRKKSKQRSPQARPEDTVDGPHSPSSSLVDFRCDNGFSISAPAASPTPVERALTAPTLPELVPFPQLVDNGDTKHDFGLDRLMRRSLASASCRTPPPSEVPLLDEPRAVVAALNDAQAGAF